MNPELKKPLSLGKIISFIEQELTVQEGQVICLGRAEVEYINNYLKKLDSFGKTDIIQDALTGPFFTSKIK